MMPATKHFDPVLGIDVHIIQPPGPVPPVPIPHPFVGIISDPMDYLPIIGATVKINFLPRALAGTQGIATPPHIPIGGVFVKPPANECECFMGVSTINCDGDALCHMTLPVLSCQCIGMPPIPRIRKKGAIKSLVLPTSVVLSIPAGPPVLIAGPPTISLMALAMKVGMGAVGKAFKKFKATKLGKKLGDKAKKVKSKVKSKFKKKPAANKHACKNGEPVHAVTGANVDNYVDWESPELLHLRWERFYSSLDSDQDVPIGRGFRHSWQHELRVTEKGFAYRSPEGELVELPPLDPQMPASDNDGVVVRLDDSGRYELSAALQPTLWFTRDDRHAMYPNELEINGELLSLEYDDQAWLKGITDSQGNQLKFAYDRRGHVTQISIMRDRKEQPLLHYVYDEHGCLISWSDAFDQLGRYEFDAQHRMTRKTDRNGYSYHCEYDAEGKCVHTWGDDGLYEIWLEYFPEEFRTAVIWADGARYDNFYDEQGTLTKVVDPTGGVTLYELDDAGNVVKEIEPNGDETEYLYDQDGANTGRVDASGQFLLPLHMQPHRPDGLGYELPHTPLGWTLGELASTASVQASLVDGLVQQSFAADELRNAGDVAAWEPVEARRELDLMGRVTLEADDDARTTRFNYDANGNITRKRDADGACWSYQYKSWNLIDEERTPISAVTKYDYNIREEVTRVEDPGGTVTDYGYDLCDRLTSVTRGGKLRESYRYTAGGALSEKLDANGEPLLKLEPGPYDTHTAIELADGAKFQYQCNDRARVELMTGPQHAVEFAYDSFDHVVLDARNGKGIEHTADGSTRVVTYLGKYEFRYQPNAQGSLELLDSTSSLTSLHADGGGRFLRSSDDGVRELRCYDQRGLCTATLVKASASPPWQTTYAYSAAGVLKQKVDSRLGRTEYQYDAAHRLAKQTNSGREEVFAYDMAGNLLSQPGLTGVKIGECNQLEATSDETIRYNHRRHISQRVRSDGTVHEYKYNSLDQLVEVTNDDGFRWTAQYDGLNRRTRKEWTDGYESHSIEFYWDHRRLAAEVIDEQTVRLYVYADRESFVPLLMIEYDSQEADPASGHRYHLIADQRGQITEVISSDGQVVWQADPQPYGEVQPHTIDDFQFNLRLAGQYADDELGLYYNRYRYYDPRLGRFIQTDPIGLAGGINTYAHTDCPLVETDLEGLEHLRSKGKSKSRSKTEGGPTGAKKRSRSSTHYRRFKKHMKAVKSHLRKYQRKVRQGKKTKAQVTEAKGEKAAAEFMRKNNPDFEIARGFEPGKGFDQVWVKKNPRGEIVEFKVVEAKGHGAKLGTGADKGDQMSQEWVENTAREMADNGDEVGKGISNALENGPPPKVTGEVIEATKSSRGATSYPPSDIPDGGVYN